MKKVKVYLGNISCDYQVILPYSSGLLRAYADQDPIIKENVEWAPFLSLATDGVQQLFEKIENPNVLGLSCYVWNFNRTVKLTRLVKEKYPNCLIIVGGPSAPTSESDYFKDFPHADIIVRGEGEITFQKILCNIISGTPSLSQIGGLIFREDGIDVETGQGDLLPNNFDYPSPYLLEYFKENLKELDERKIERECLIETNRGCPFTCIYCFEGNYNRRFRTVDWDRVVKDIEYIGSEMDRITVVDTNFGMLNRDIDVAKLIVGQTNEHQRINSCHVTHGKSSSDAEQDRLIQIAEILESKNYYRYREGLTISLQTLTKDVLSSIHRKNSEIYSFETFQDKLNSKGIPHNVELIVGLPNETTESMFETYELVLKGYPADVRLYGLMLLPNTELNTRKTRENYQIDTRIVCFFEGVEEDENEYLEQVIATKKFSREDLESFLKWREFFQYTYFGKWTYFICEYINQVLGIRRVDLHRDLMKYAYLHKGSVLEKCLKGWYINNWNSGSYVKFRGPISPYNIDWGDNYFHKNTFHWLCISTVKNQFYNELKDFVVSIETGERIDDLMKFQEETMIDFNFDASGRERFTYKYNWFEYFHGGKPLAEKKNTTTYTTCYKTSDPENYFLQAGGHPQFFQKIKAFIHRDVEIDYYEEAKTIYKSNSITGIPKQTDV